MNVSEKENPKEEAERLGFDVVYVPYEKIEDYNACYRVRYRGEEIYPPAADRLGIPMNEIWLSEKLKEFEKYILYHELREIKYRYAGHSVEKAHEKAVEDEKVFEGDPEWEKLSLEINMASPEKLDELAGLDEKTFEDLMRNRPYYEMDELESLDSIDGETCEKLKENFWSMYEEY